MLNTSSLTAPLLVEEEQDYYKEQFNRVIEFSFERLDKVLGRYKLFHLSFVLLFLTELSLLIVFFSTLLHSFFAALSFSALFFTLFAYFTLRLYFQTKKQEDLYQVLNIFLSASKEILEYSEENAEHQLALANACCKFANRLHGREYTYYRLPSWLGFIASEMEKFSCWCHWQDIHLMKEFLLQASIEEHLKIVKGLPTSLESHAGLANAYVMLSGLYIDPRKLEGYEDDRWISEKKYSDEFSNKFRIIAEKAIEEFKILNEYAPDDPWVHSQLAYSYHDLQMPLEEIKEYETIYRLIPEDRENLYKLGTLYFQQGLNAKGLRVYEELKRRHFKKAENLIKHYGSTDSFSFYP